MEFSNNLFWDADISNIDYDKHAGHIVPRVFMRGTMEDILQVIRYYGKERVAEILMNTRYLDKISLAFATGLFNLKKDDFRCYKLNQSSPRLWNY